MKRKHHSQQRYLFLILMTILMLLLLSSCTRNNGTHNDEVMTNNSKIEFNDQYPQDHLKEELKPSIKQSTEEFSPLQLALNTSQEETDQWIDSEQVARDFIEENFSLCSGLEEWNKFHSESGHMSLFLELRTEIAQSRRKLSESGNTNSISLEKVNEYIDGEAILYHFTAVEHIDSGIAKTQYVLLLQEEADEWKLISALSDDSGSMQFVGKPFIREVQDELYQKNLKETMRLMHEMPTKILDPEEMIRISKLENETIQQETALYSSKVTIHRCCPPWYAPYSMKVSEY